MTEQKDWVENMVENKKEKHSFQIFEDLYSNF